MLPFLHMKGTSMPKNNNFIPNFRGQGEKSQEKRPPQKIYRKFNNKKTKGDGQQKNQAKQKQLPVKKNPPKPRQEQRQPQHRNQPQQRKNRDMRTTPLKIFALGGLNEIGKNIYVYECANDIFVIDCGLAFPDDEMPGVDSVIPDFTYLEKNKDRVRGVVLTHGHEDHIGGLPYLLKKVNVPVYGTRLTLGLVEGKLREHGILASAKLVTVKPGDTVKLGCMSAELSVSTTPFPTPAPLLHILLREWWFIPATSR